MSFIFTEIRSFGEEISERFYFKRFLKKTARSVSLSFVLFEHTFMPLMVKFSH